MRQKVRTFAVTSIFLISPLATHAKITESQCSKKDFSSRFVPPKDQGNAGFCYSFAASDLVAEAASVKPPDTVSAFYAGSQYISMSQDEVKKANAAIVVEKSKAVPEAQMGSMGGTFGGGGGSVFGFNPDVREHNPTGKKLLAREGGQTDLIAAHLINQGHVCLEKDIHSEILGRKYQDSEQQNFFSMQMGRMAGGPEFNELKKNKQLYYQLKNTCMVNPPLEGLDQLRSFDESLQDWFAQHLRDKVNQECKSPVDLKGLKVHRRSFADKEKNPESADYMMSVMNQDRPFVLHYNVSLLRNWPADRSPWHASIVTGRRWNQSKKTCEVVIKNSWGENCEEALESGTCDKGVWYLDVEKIANDKSEVIWIQK